MYEDLKEAARKLKEAGNNELAERIAKAVFNKILEECTINLRLTQGQDADHNTVEEEFIKIFLSIEPPKDPRLDR